MSVVRERGGARVRLRGVALERVVADVGAVPVTDERVGTGNRAGAVVFEAVPGVVAVEAVGPEGIVGGSGTELAVTGERRLHDVGADGVVCEIAVTAANSFAVASERLGAGVCFVAVACERELVVTCGGVVGCEAEVGDVDELVVVFELAGDGGGPGTVAGEVCVCHIAVFSVVVEVAAVAG